MKQIIKVLLCVCLLAGLAGLNSCADQVEVTPDKDLKVSSSISSQTVAATASTDEPNCEVKCENCGNLITNGSFETINGTIPSTNLFNVTGNNVPPCMKYVVHPTSWTETYP